MFHSGSHVRKKLKEALPTNQAELMHMQHSDPRLKIIGQKM